MSSHGVVMAAQREIRRTLDAMPCITDVSAHVPERLVAGIERRYGVRVIRAAQVHAALVRTYMHVVRLLVQTQSPVVFLTEGATGPGDRKSAEFFVAGFVRYLNTCGRLPAGLAEHVWFLDDRMSHLLKLDTLRLAAQGQKEVCVVILNDGVFTGRQQSIELNNLMAMARATGVHVHANVAIPFACREGLDRLRAIAAPHGSSITVWEPVHQLNRAALEFFQHKGPPDSFPPEVAKAIEGELPRPIYKAMRDRQPTVTT